jgi:predicted aconitase with swiveling domain
MRKTTTKNWLIPVLLLLTGALAAPVGSARQRKPTPQPAHVHHEAMDRDELHHDHSGHDPNHEGMEVHTDLKVTRVFRPLENFVGNLASDQETGRLWLLSYGPPANTKGPSTLYEVEPTTGKVLAQARMPFLGEFGAPVYIDGFLYVGIAVESKLYKVAVNDRANLGKIVQTVPLPTLNDLEINFEEPFRFPFINFPSIAATPDKNILLNAEDLGLFIKIDKETGRIMNQVSSMKGLSAAINVSGPNQEAILLGNTDPEAALLKRDMRVFLFRARHGFTPPYAIRTEMPCKQQGARDITWVLLDPQSGEVLASALDRCSRTSAGSVALLKQEKRTGTRYGSYTFLANSDEGILTVEWVPR